MLLGSSEQLRIGNILFYTIGNLLKIADPNPCVFPHHLDLIQDLPNSFSVKLGSLFQSDIPVPCVSHVVLILLTSHGYSIGIFFRTAPGRVLFLFILEVYVMATGYVLWVFVDELFVYKVNFFSSCSSVVMNGSWRLRRLVDYDYFI